ncbi:hypothetical protein MKW92_008292 [Papaver armeniacum]|nr:hypothetical protein MKW92_008292 [Papaver armeniacum]
MAKLFCAAPVFVACFVLLLITLSVSADRTCRFDGGAWGTITEGRGPSCRSCMLTCFKNCGESKYRQVYQPTCDIMPGNVNACLCCCSLAKKLFNIIEASGR